MPAKPHTAAAPPLSGARLAPPPAGKRGPCCNEFSKVRALGRSVCNVNEEIIFENMRLALADWVLLMDLPTAARNMSASATLPGSKGGLSGIAPWKRPRWSAYANSSPAAPDDSRCASSCDTPSRDTTSPAAAAASSVAKKVSASLTRSCRATVSLPPFSRVSAQVHLLIHYTKLIH